MKKTVAIAVSLLRKFVTGLLRPHSGEMLRGTRFQEEARSERLTNVVRFCFVLAWITIVTLWPFGDKSLCTTLYLAVCLTWMGFTIVFHALLMLRSYKPYYKYASTTVDMLFAVALMIAYVISVGPAFVFKTPTFIHLVYAIGFAALRFDRNLVVYATLLAIALMGKLWFWLHHAIGLEYGTRLEHTFGHKLNFFYAMDILLYMGMFGFLTAMSVMNLRRQMDLRVVEAERAAREQERALMASALAHEVRNPLAGIYGFAQLIRDEGSAEKRHVEAILDDARRLNGVVEDFLQFSRPFSVRPASVDLVALAGDFCRRLTALHADTPLAFGADKDELVLRTDAEAITQMLLNLVQNARRFQPPGIPIRVTLAGDQSEACIQVEDGGPGVDPSMLPGLFTPFRTSGGGGTGLGLALTRKIARQLGGDVLYEDRLPGPGACFTLVLKPVIGEGDA